MQNTGTKMFVPFSVMLVYAKLLQVDSQFAEGHILICWDENSLNH